MVSEKEINNGVMAIFNIFRRVSVQKEKVIKDYANTGKNMF